MREKIDWRFTFKVLLTGFFIGLGGVAPGISGGAIAVVFGLYPVITESLATIHKQFWQKCKFLLPLAIGALLSVVLFSNVIDYLFDHYNTSVRCLFIGLMAGTIPAVFRTANKQGYRHRYWIPFAVAFAAIVVCTMWIDTSAVAQTRDLPVWLLAASGALLGFGTIVPGISSSFLLMAIGAYEPILHALIEWNVRVLIPVGVGFLVFVVLFIKLVHWAYQKAYGPVSYAVCGLLVGSMIPVIPPLAFDALSAVAVLLGLLGAALSWYLLRFEKG